MDVIGLTCARAEMPLALAVLAPRIEAVRPDRILPRNRYRTRLAEVPTRERIDGDVAGGIGIDSLGTDPEVLDDMFAKCHLLRHFMSCS